MAAITAGMTAATTTHIADATAGAGAGDDTVLGGTEDNGLWGNSGNDSLEGRAGHDHLYGGADNDVLWGGAGNDSLSGGAGDDTVVLTGARADYAVSLTADGLIVADLRAGAPDGTDTIGGVEHVTFSDGTLATSALTGWVVVKNLDAGANVFAAATDNHYVVAGLAGADSLTTRGGFDTITGGTGNDSIYAGGGDDTIVFSCTNTGFDGVDGGAGFDKIVATTAGTFIGLHSLTGIKEITANGLVGVAIKGDASANLLDVSATVLTGISRIEGGLGADTLIGSAGSDVISGGSGKDLLTGGLGADTFVFAAASASLKATSDVITDFTTGVDHIDLSLIDANTLLTGDQAFAFVGHALFTHTAGELRLVGAGAGFAQLLGDLNGDGIGDFALRFALTTGDAPVLTDLSL